LLALVQISAQRSGAESPISVVGMSCASFVENAVTSIGSAIHSGANGILSIPQLEHNNTALTEQNKTLTEENAQLHELAATYAAEVSVRPTVEFYNGIEARVVGFPPENDERAVTVDRGSNAGIHKDDGVLTAEGVVGRVSSVTPVSSTIVLVTDYTSRLPAIVRRGRWWGIARGNLASIRVEFIPQDAPLKIGDVVVTGEGRSFRSGIPIGTVTHIERGDSTLYQTAVLKPAVDLGALDRVVIVAK
jgi:rod shape-determining protein MreC